MGAWEQRPPGWGRGTVMAEMKSKGVKSLGCWGRSFKGGSWTWLEQRDGRRCLLKWVGIEEKQDGAWKTKRSISNRLFAMLMRHLSGKKKISLAWR